MTTDEFVRALKLVVIDSAGKELRSVLEKPAGRSPAKHLLEWSRRYHELPERDQEFIGAVANEAAFRAVFGVLAVLDGVSVVEDTPEKGRFELRYLKGCEDCVLNPVGAEMLHDVLVGLPAADRG